MATLTKKEKYHKIIQLMFHEYTAKAMADELGYSVSYIHLIYEELRNKYGVSSKMGIARAYVNDELKRLSEEMNELILLTSTGNFTSNAQGLRGLPPSQKKKKK